MPRTQKLPEIDTRQASDGSYSIAITLNSVTVTGGLTTVIFTAKNAANGADDGNWQVGDFFFNGEYEIPVNDSGDKMKISNNGRADGVTVGERGGGIDGQYDGFAMSGTDFDCGFDICRKMDEMA